MIFFFITKDGKVSQHRSRTDKVVGGGVLYPDQLARVYLTRKDGTFEVVDYSFDELRIRRHEGKYLISTHDGYISKIDIFTPGEKYEKKL